MEMYGPLENIELFSQKNPSFAFVKYKRVSDATKAFENQKNIILMGGWQQLKITFSDHLRRFNIVGDCEDYENPDELTNVIYLGYIHNNPFAREEIIRKFCAKYGEVKNFLIKRFENTTFKTYALIEFESQDVTQRIYEKLLTKRHKLCDKKMEITILIKNEKLQQVQRKTQPAVNVLHSSPPLH